MLALMAAGGVVFPGLFVLSRLGLRFLMGWSEADATIVSVRHWLTEAYVSFAAPYFVYDMYAMFLCHCHQRRQQGDTHVAAFVRREMLMVLHHAFMVLFCLPASLVWRRGKGDYFQGVLLLAELSTPFVSLAKVLMQLEKEHTLLYKVNGVLTLLVFFACRVALFPYLYLAYSRYASMSVHQAVLEAPWQCNVGAALLWPLQVYWMALMCRRAFRLLTGRSHTKVKKTP
ncbi:ceramide synthase-like isoform X2 [Dunckerocampus dactyliophorus]|uniref:ceramide synthase-like isoform X2 n=1 Tax=Dunckerocampus dactyliophorus TaxID=161453 RepID=UPI002406A36C|nr:ceramide synthase-like isoform X2 [Dunckerocampus dactyliophorus]